MGHFFLYPVLMSNKMTLTNIKIDMMEKNVIIPELIF